MIRHIVLWKIDDTYSSDEKTKIKKQLNDKLLNLLNLIDELRFLEIGFNLKNAGTDNFDVLLDTKFDSLEDLKKYQAHPEHVKVAGYIKTLKLKRASIDYEI